jgi:K(+)-stimulated pyrophosphate-energized sodium pump
VTRLGLVLTVALAALFAAPTALAAPELQGVTRPALPILWWLMPLGAIVALVVAYILYSSVVSRDEGTDVMIDIAQAVREGAMAYLNRQYRIVTIVFVVLFVILLAMSLFGLQNFWVPFAFLTGGFFSGVCGFIGMKTATNASARTANAARQSLNDGLQVAFRAGAVMGLSVVGFALLDTTLWFLVLYYATSLDLASISVVLLSAAMGASTQALFARVGGGIYTKAADVGADLVGKVEAGIPEDDPRNPATIADNVGDNVGDVAGMGADLYESYVPVPSGQPIALGVAAVATAAAEAPQFLGGLVVEAVQIRYLTAPMAIAGIGVILSIIGIYLVRTKEDASMGDLMGALTRSITITSILIAIAAIPIIYMLGLPNPLWCFWLLLSPVWLWAKSSARPPSITPPMNMGRPKELPTRAIPARPPLLLPVGRWVCAQPVSRCWLSCTGIAFQLLPDRRQPPTP